MTSRNFLWIISVLILLICIILVCIYPFYIGTNISTDADDWVKIGSYVGGVTGPLLSLLAFFGVLISISYQTISGKRTEEINTITKHIELHQNLTNELKIQYGATSKQKTKEGRMIFDYLYESQYKTLFSEVENENPDETEDHKINEAFDKLYDQYGSQFGYYFRNFYYLIKFLNESEYLDKKYYSTLIRAQLCKSELQLLFYNCLSSRGKIYFKPLVEEYGLLNGINKNEILKVDHIKLFESSAFN
jgi:hypothetical protein